MIERYWDAVEPPEGLREGLLDWVNDNVCEALEWAWSQRESYALLEVKNGTVFITVAGPEKPEEPGKTTCLYEVRHNLLDLIKEYADDNNEYAAPALHDLAESILKISDEASK